MVVFGQKFFYLGKSGSIRAKWLSLRKVVVFGKSGSNWANVIVFGKK